jgi:predicted metalloprotease with PDZ domain
MRTLSRLTFALTLAAGWTAPGSAQLHYTVDLRSPTTHTAAVTLRVDSLAARDSVFQFAATAPGTYQTMNIGRFVLELHASDARGREIPVRRLSVNRWRIGDPRRVRQVSWHVQDTWNAVVSEFPVYVMAGSEIASDHALLNAHAILGFPPSMQGAPVTLSLLYPPGWAVETALRSGPAGYVAESYDELVDSPILLGKGLTTATLTVTGVPVRIAAYTPSGQITAPRLADAMRGMLEAAGRFLGRLPVDRYVFLYRFAQPRADGIMGAWEHGTSSEYVLVDAPWSERQGAGITSIAAHEFFHVVTPLNVHSEIIEHFNFETPTPSLHLWLYEGVTEWASDKMQQEGGLQTLEAYLAEVARKARNDRTRYDTTYSLTRIAETSFTPAGARQFGNVYERGALVAGLLDIRLLQLSGGRSGLRTLVRGLARDYGRHRPFPEDSIFSIVAARTSPEILDFFARYVRGTERPPLKAMYALLGIDLVEDAQGLPTRFVVDPNPTPEQLRLREAWLRSGTEPSP